MKFDEIMELADADAALDYSELGIEATRLTKLIIKWLKIYSTEKIVYVTLKKKDESIYKELSDYYSGRGGPDGAVFEHRLLKEDVKIYINNDSRYRDIKDKIDLQEIKIEFLENFIKALHSRGYNIKTALDWCKFSNGQ